MIEPPLQYMALIPLSSTMANGHSIRRDASVDVTSMITPQIQDAEMAMICSHMTNGLHAAMHEASDVHPMGYAERHDVIMTMSHGVNGKGTQIIAGRYGRKTSACPDPGVDTCHGDI
jgi:hypothetical protein